MSSLTRSRWAAIGAAVAVSFGGGIGDNNVGYLDLLQPPRCVPGQGFDDGFLDDTEPDGKQNGGRKSV
ncbi:MAG TPA: hypothetical protein VES40_00180, partial [Ilumatobacteraceae bacterium]|nr:hypothetical protein [Ilumatobacteraceae bacterium]